MDRQAVGVHDRVNLGRQAPSRATHILMIVVRDAGSVLVPEKAIEHVTLLHAAHAARLVRQHRFGPFINH
jgi:hypothetical protein